MRLIGSFYHALEQKGRLSLPSGFREQMTEPYILTLGLDGCLFLFQENDWEEILSGSTQMNYLKKRYRDWQRILANNASSVSPDKAGRILIPEFLRKKADLVKDVVLVGSLNRVEIWDRKMYHEYFEELEKSMEDIAEGLSKVSNE